MGLIEDLLNEDTSYFPVWPKQDSLIGRRVRWENGTSTEIDGQYVGPVATVIRADGHRGTTIVDILLNVEGTGNFISTMTNHVFRIRVEEEMRFAKMRHAKRRESR